MLRARLPVLRKWPFNYGVAAAFVVVAFGIRLALQPLLEHRSPFLAFVFAIALAAIYCGYGPAILAVGVSVVLGVVFFIAPHHDLLPPAAADVAQVLMFLLPSIFIIVLAEVAERDRQTTRRAMDRFRLLTEQARDYAVITMDPKGRILTWSKGAEALFGFKVDEVLGNSGALLFTPDDRRNGALDKEILHAVQHGHAPCERWLARRDGSTFFALGILIPLRDQSGGVVELAKFLRDGSHIKHRENQLIADAQHSQRALLETTEQVDAFTHSVAHDLRAPLRAMDGFAKVLRDEFGEQLGERGRDYVDRILKSAHRMDELVTDLLEFWRLARMRIQPHSINAEDILNSVVENLAPDLASHRIRVQRAAPLPMVNGHPECLYKAFYHLICNAIKFSGDGPAPVIEIGSEQRDGYVRLFVQDNGPGIPPQYHRKIFKVFERISQDKPGTGIGLSIVHKCAELMGGHAGVDSTPGYGSCFWLDIPEVETTEH